MNRIIVSLLTILATCTACVKAIPSPTSSKPKIAVSCILGNSDVQKLTLTYSKELFSGRLFEEVEQATITLYKENEEVGKFSKTSEGEWELNYRPEVGKCYQLQVEIAGEKTMRATTTMPDAVGVIRNLPTDNNHTKVFTQKTQLDPFWMFCMDSNLVGDDYIITFPQLEDDPRPRLLQRIGTDHKNADRFNQEGTANDFDSQYGSTLLYKYYARVTPDNSINDENQYVFHVQHPSTEASFVVFRSVSKEYDRYLKSIIEKMTYYESEDDPIRLFDEAVIYSNIENGLGIFGAYHQTSFYFNNTLLLE